MDFVLAYPHAPAEVPLYMRFPKGYEFKDGISEDTHVLKLSKNIYGQKQAGRVGISTWMNDSARLVSNPEKWTHVCIFAAVLHSLFISTIASCSALIWQN